MMSQLISIVSTKSLWLIIFATFLIFSHTTQNSFVWDDHAFIENQSQTGFQALFSAIKSTYPVAGSHTFRPVRNIFYAVLAPLFQSKPVIYHLFVLGLHLFCIILVYILLSQLIQDETASLLGALVFAIHPIHTENIYWVTAGFDLIFVIFLLMSVISHFYASSNSQIASALSYCFAILAVLSNEIALVIPVLIILIDGLWFKKPILPKSTGTPYLIYFLISMIGLLGRAIFISESSFGTRVYQSLFEELKLGLILFGSYLHQFHFPLPLTVDHFFMTELTGLFSQNHHLLHPVPSLNLLSIQLIIPFVFVVFWFVITGFLLIRRNPISAPFLWIFITLLPVLRIVPLPIIYSERYAYTASIGFVWLIASIYHQFKHSLSLKNTMIIFIIAVAGYWAGLSYQAGFNWRSDSSVWSHVLKYNISSAAAYSALGVEAYIQNDLVASFSYHEKAALMNPYVSSYQQNYLSSLVRQQKYQSIIDFVGQIIKTDAKNVDLYTLLASAYDELGNYSQAMKMYQTAFDLLPRGSMKSVEIEELVQKLDQKYQIVDPT